MERSKFIERAVLKHNNKYTYERVPHSFGCMEKIQITCPVHGDFLQQATSHAVGGRGCKQCTGHKLVDTKSFIVRAIKIHGDIYDYSETIYAKAHDKVKIVCRKHGSFEMTAAAHIHQKQGCRKCNNTLRYDAEESIHSKAKVSFIFKANNIHNNLFDYSKVEYVRSFIKVEVLCKEHGSFYITPNNHLRGKGCGVCKAGGFNLNLEGSIYLLTDGVQLKIGITNSSAETRCNTINQLGKKNFKVLWSHTDIGKEIQHIEKLSLNEVRELYKNPVDKFNGYTECFVTQDIEFILNIIKKNIQSC
jgi:hypothetical protein